MTNKIDTPHVDDNSFSTIIVMLIVFLVTCAIFIFYQRKKSSKRGVLLTGLCDSGKTLLFSQLVHGEYVNTQTSMKENFGDFIISNGTLRLVDIPGYERLRGKFIDQYKSTARSIMYVVDSVTIQKEIRDVAEFLYTILLDPVIADNISSLLVVCNKQDLPLARTTTVVKGLLEKELNALRVTKSSQLESVDQKSSKTAVLGKEGKDFSFASLPLKVDFVGASALGDAADRADLEKWLENLC